MRKIVISLFFWLLSLQAFCQAGPDFVCGGIDTTSGYTTLSQVCDIPERGTKFYEKFNFVPYDTSKTSLKYIRLAFI